ncbi:hypothetical protein AN619_26600 [Thermotalea metallivorans]|uniref:Uncharacterized protein n=1 Tax=Thermotalea metallivorans TaxID=520762 RepID=A0A140L0H5_9FIRM|nr:hypothetical protein AN619_26600 [Thermotalea metallivorans]
MLKHTTEIMTYSQFMKIYNFLCVIKNKEKSGLLICDKAETSRVYKHCIALFSVWLMIIWHKDFRHKIFGMGMLTKILGYNILKMNSE